MGCGIETSSHKYGLFQHTCISYDIIIANGDLIHCSKVCIDHDTTIQDLPVFLLKFIDNNILMLSLLYHFIKTSICTLQAGVSQGCGGDTTSKKNFLLEFLLHVRILHKFLEHSTAVEKKLAAMTILSVNFHFKPPQVLPL